jgi:hypothetical protein
MLLAESMRAMLSLERCRSLIGPDTNVCDAQLEQLRKDLYSLANAALESFRHREKPHNKYPAGQNPPPLHKATAPESISLLPVAERYLLEERAAILEFEAGLNRQDAERQALLEWARPSSSGRQVQQRKRSKKSSNISPGPR